VSEAAAEGNGKTSSRPPVRVSLARRIAIAIAIGVSSGFVAGLFGVGGGILIVPALVLVLGMEQRLAHGTSLGAIVPIAVAGVAGYVWSGSVDWVAVVILVGGAALGAVAGTHALQRLPQRVLRVVFSVYLLVTAASLFLTVGSTAAERPLTVLTVSGLVFIGFAAGTIAGLLGVGGGVVTVPAMILLVSMPVAVAKGTALAVTVPTAVVGTVRNLGVRNADLVLAAIIGIAGMASSYGAARLSVTMDPRLSKALFACLQVVVAATLLLTRDGRREE
jgi:hypothetical protein